MFSSNGTDILISSPTNDMKVEFMGVYICCAYSVDEKGYFLYIITALQRIKSYQLDIHKENIQLQFSLWKISKILRPQRKSVHVSSIHTMIILS